MSKWFPAILALALAAAAPAARAELALVPRGPVYADAKGVALKAPEGVGCNAKTLAVADTGNARLVLFDLKDGAIGGGTEVKVPQVSYPVRVQIDSKGNLLVLDRKAKRIARLDAKGTLLGWADPKGVSGVLPGAFKLDASDNLYILDVAGSAVLVLDPSGAVTRKLELPRTNTLFMDVAADGAGTIYAVDARGGLVWSVDKAGTEFKPLTKSLKDVMSFPTYLATDGKGLLYVVDQNGDGIVLLGLDGSYLGRRLAIGWTEGMVYYPTQLCLDGSGDMVVADRGNDRVQLFSMTR